MTANTRERFTRPERRLIDRLRTPLQVQRYLKTLPYNWEREGATLRSFRGVVETGEAHCLEAVVFAATVLEQHGYPSLVLDIESQDNLDHVVFLYRENGRYGTIGRSRCWGLHGREPVYRSIRDVALSYVDPFVDPTARLIGYGTANLNDLRAGDWRFSRRSVWALERALIAMPHTPVQTGEARHQRMFRRFAEFMRAHPRATDAQWRRLYGATAKHWL